MSGAYYNEHDPFAAEWLRRLILFGHIAENLTVLYGLPIVTTPLYGRQVVVTGGFVE